jgi:hypothetical protein
MDGETGGIDPNTPGSDEVSRPEQVDVADDEHEPCCHTGKAKHLSAS